MKKVSFIIVLYHMNVHERSLMIMNDNEKEVNDNEKKMNDNERSHEQKRSFVIESFMNVHNIFFIFYSHACI